MINTIHIVSLVIPESITKFEFSRDLDWTRDLSIATYGSHHVEINTVSMVSIDASFIDLIAAKACERKLNGLFVKYQQIVIDNL